MLKISKNLQNCTKQKTNAEIPEINFPTRNNQNKHGGEGNTNRPGKSKFYEVLL